MNVFKIIIILFSIIFLKIPIIFDDFRHKMRAAHVLENRPSHNKVHKIIVYIILNFNIASSSSP